MKKYFVLVLFIPILFLKCSKENYQMEFAGFVEKKLPILKELIEKEALAFWNANATGEKKYFDELEKIELEIKKIYSNKEDFEFLKKVKSSGKITDPLQKRELTILYNNYAFNQIDSSLMKKIVSLSTEIIKKFNNYRPKIDGIEKTDNQILDILKEEKDSNLRKKAWEASKQVGKVIEKDLLTLVKLRNEAARNLGYKNFYEMSMELSEQNVDEVVNIFNKIKEYTDESFSIIKKEIDSKLAKRFSISIDNLRPWHYADPFFQNVPPVTEIDFDKYYKGKDVVKLTKEFYESIGLDVEDILKNSDLYERSGKYPHAFCIDMNRNGDIRTMQNIRDNVQWMETMLHELGHGVYSKYIDRSLPYFLRTESHLLTTEAIAQLMEREAKNPEWLKTKLNISDKEKNEIIKIIREESRKKALIFCRWSLVMLYFEKSLYENPDQNLNKLWWDLVEKFQYIKRPENRDEPDYAAKIHLSQNPVYYHNYLLGEIMGAQLLNYIMKNIIKSNDYFSITFYQKLEVGNYLKNEIFKPGSSLYWNDLIKKSTGEYLNPKYYIEQYVNN